MSWFFKLIVIILVNAAMFLAMAKYVPGFELEADYGQVLVIAVIFTALNFFLKPILKLILGPIIVLTLGLGLVAVNIALLYLLDILVKNLTIYGMALIWGALIIGFVNFMLHLVLKK